MDHHMHQYPSQGMSVIVVSVSFANVAILHVALVSFSWYAQPFSSCSLKQQLVQSIGRLVQNIERERESFSVAGKLWILYHNVPIEPEREKPVRQWKAYAFAKLRCSVQQYLRLRETQQASMLAEMDTDLSRLLESSWQFASYLIKSYTIILRFIEDYVRLV